MNITLIGMPGAGKSVVGKRLAERLGYECIDTDTILEEQYRLPLQSVLEQLGAEAFLKKEAEIVISQTSGRSNLVVSPGGSAVYDRNTMKHLKNVSKIFYLKVPLPALTQRIGTTPRGIVGAQEKTLEELYAERVPLYESYADYTINGDQEAETVVSDIVSAVLQRTAV